MKLIKPKFWDSTINLFSILLFPLSLAYLLFIFFKKKITKKHIFKIPIICVGNIYIGGTGKTPTSILLANELFKLGKKPVIIRKFYKGHKDEFKLIKSSFEHLIISKNRINALREAESSNFNIAILDDGLQDYKIKKNFNIVCFNQRQLIGNGMVLPAGPLRESLSSIKLADIVIINGNKDKNFEEKLYTINNKLEIFYSKYKAINLDEFKNKKLLAVAGIGNPENFFTLIKENNLVIAKKLVFPDHYQFSKEEIQDIIREAESKNYKIIMTEKDYFKIKDYNFEKIHFLKISLEINRKQELLKKINQYD